MTKGRTADAWGVQRKVMGLMPGRKTFVLDRNGIVVHAFQSAFDVKEHINGALQAIHTLREAEMNTSNTSSLAGSTSSDQMVSAQ